MEWPAGSLLTDKAVTTGAQWTGLENVIRHFYNATKNETLLHKLSISVEVPFCY